MSTESADNTYLSAITPSLRTWADAVLTFKQLGHQLAAAKIHWEKTLGPLKLRKGDVVGLWLTGRKLADPVNAIAISACGLVPQFFGSGGKALIADDAYLSELLDHPLPAFAGVSLETADEAKGSVEGVLDDIPPVALSDYGPISHSSGPTAGLPKIIPNTHAMLRAVVQDKWPGSASGVMNNEKPIVVNTLGNFAQIGSFHTFLSAIHGGFCVVQPSSMAIPAPELVAMIRVCSLNPLALYATFLSNLIREAKKDANIKYALQNLDQIIHTGVALNKEDEEWAHANDIKITTMYGTTQTAPLLSSRIGTEPSSRILRPIRGDGRQLFEIVVRPSAPDCPPEPLRGVDGNYHSDDLTDGCTVGGRAGDWIKLHLGFCDTKNIEDNVRKTCTDLVHDVVVIGTHRPAPCLVRQLVAQEIVARTLAFNERQFAHERIQDPKKVFMVDQGTLPRTNEKGKVRRLATEEMFSKKLDDTFTG
ncbi:acetyl-CoA synthetase-like protein [Amylostereum chailletii]|nr:acetyl-CoA synthetase-like protein [Amylostereum chailletii]